MALTQIQRDIMASIAPNRSETSYMAGGLVLNEAWLRLSDDMDIFHDSDEEIVASADKDIATLKDKGFKVAVDVREYGIVEATISRDRDSTVIQWMSETRTRFFPLVRDKEWGARLHLADLAINKVIASSTRTKARDFVDLVTIDTNYCPLGVIVMAAAGKPPNYSPVRMIDEMRRRGLSIQAEEYESVRGVAEGFTAAAFRDELVAALDRAESYARSAPAQLVGLLAIDDRGTPTMTTDLRQTGVTYRRATIEPEVMPDIAAEIGWRP